MWVSAFCAGCAVFVAVVPVYKQGGGMGAIGKDPKKEKFFGRR